LTTRLILIRHGQTRHNVEGRMAGWTDSPLTDLGRSQAERLARHVADRYRLDRIYASPLQRARLTAEAVGRRAHLRPILRDDLKEINFGKLESLTKEEIGEQFPGMVERRDEPVFEYPEGESAEHFTARVRDAFRSIIAENEGRTVAVVSHGGVLGAYVSDLESGEPHLWRRFVPQNCAITEVVVEDGATTLACFDEAGHLEDREVVAPTLVT
jgi:broad specificity phosphatase PhoE